MSVSTYLTNLASSLLLQKSEKEKIAISISTIKNRLTNYFSTDVILQYQFGSSVRETILPRSADNYSDIDYLIVFDTSQNIYKPQTYLNKLQKFSEYYYSSSEIHQSYPVIKLELNHIIFDLVPAISNSQLQIPSPSNYWNDWINTNPSEFDIRLSISNGMYNYLIKPLIRLCKYWNTINGHHFSSFDLEEFIVGLTFWGKPTIKDCFFHFWDCFSCDYSTPDYIKSKVNSAKQNIKNISYYDEQGYTSVAEEELKKLLPWK